MHGQAKCCIPSRSTDSNDADEQRVYVVPYAHWHAKDKDRRCQWHQLASYLHLGPGRQDASGISVDRMPVASC